MTLLDLWIFINICGIMVGIVCFIPSMKAKRDYDRKIKSLEIKICKFRRPQSDGKIRIVERSESKKGITSKVKRL